LRIGMNSSAKLVLKIPVFSPYRSELQSLHLRYPTTTVRFAL
jgi:hypothetical protein